MSTAAAYTADSVLADEKIISADSHIMEADDLWVKNLTPSLKPKYPNFPKRNSPGERDGGWDPKARISEMEVDGVSAVSTSWGNSWRPSFSRTLVSATG